MRYLFTLDVPSLPQMIVNFASRCWWMIVIAALLVIGAVIGIIIFAKKNKENKK